MRKHKVKISPNYAIVEHSNFSMPGRLRFEDRVFENLLLSEKEDMTFDDICEVVNESLEEVWGAMDAESVPYRLPQK